MCVSSSGHSLAMVFIPARYFEIHNTKLEACLSLAIWNKRSFDIDVLQIKQKENELCEEFISRIQQITFDDDIPELMLVNFIAKGLQNKGIKS